MADEEEKKSTNPFFGDTPSIASQVNKAAEEQGRKGGETEDEREEREEEEKKHQHPLNNEDTIKDHLTNDKSLTDHILGS